MILPRMVFRMEDGQTGKKVLCTAEIFCPVCMLYDNLPTPMRGQIAFKEIVLGYLTSEGFKPLPESPLSHLINSGITTTSSCPFCYAMVQMNDALVQRILPYAEGWARRYLQSKLAEAPLVS